MFKIFFYYPVYITVRNRTKAFTEPEGCKNSALPQIVLELKRKGIRGVGTREEPNSNIRLWDFVWIYIATGCLVSCQICLH